MTASDTIPVQTGLSCAALLETRLVELSPDTLSFPEAAVFYHLMADGRLQKETSLPVLLPGEGCLVCCGDFYIEPLEIQIEFSKADNATDWLAGLLFRHTERVRDIARELFVLTCINRPVAISPDFS